MTQIKCSQIRNKKPDELENELNNLHKQLNLLNIDKKKQIRKSIANIHIVQNQTIKDNLRNFYHGEKYKPKDLRPKQTRAMRRLLTPKEKSITLKKTQRNNFAFPQHNYCPMPKKKQVTFQNNTPGKFIPRDDPPSTSVFRSGTNGNRFNSKMAELLASSSPPITNENEPISTVSKTSQDDPITSTSLEMTTVDSSRVHSRLLHRRIVTMLETLKRRSGSNGATSPTRSTSAHSESKSQPITFGQLRQATTTSASPPPRPSSIIDEDISSSKVLSTRSDLTPVSRNKVSSRHQPNKERLHYSPSLENLLEQQNVVPQIKEHNEQHQSKPPLSVDEILSTYYSKVKVPTTADTQSSHNMGFYVHPWNNSQTNHHIPPPRLLLNEQNKNRPPPPSYSSSIANGHRPPMNNNLAQHLIRPPVPTSIREQVYPKPQIGQHLLPGNSSINLPTSSLSVRPPPPRYESPTSNIERSHSALSSMTRPDYSQVNPPQAGFDREFSRLLYGKDGGKNRQQRQKRKAFSDPVKKSVEEAGRSVEKTHRRLTTHLNKTDTVKEEEENGSDSNDKEQHRTSQRSFQRQSILFESTRESARKAIVPANPLLNRRIPSFLRVYSQASSSNDILLQWHLFSQSELESFDAMMTRLYKDENLIRIKLYENYRALLNSTKASKTSLNKVNLNNNNNNNDDEDNSITTTAL